MSALPEPRHQVARVLDLLEALCGFAASGASNSDLAHHTGSSPFQITRDMEHLIKRGWARKDEDNGRFYLQPGFTRLVFRVDADFNRAERQLADRRRAMTGA